MILKIRSSKKGAHVHFSMWAGPQLGNLGCAGEGLCMREVEFDQLVATLRAGMPSDRDESPGRFESIIVERDDGSSIEITRT